MRAGPHLIRLSTPTGPGTEPALREWLLREGGFDCPLRMGGGQVALSGSAGDIRNGPQRGL